MLSHLRYGNGLCAFYMYLRKVVCSFKPILELNQKALHNAGFQFATGPVFILHLADYACLHVYIVGAIIIA